MCKWSVNCWTHDGELVCLHWSLVLKQAHCFYGFNSQFSVVRMNYLCSMAHFGDILRKAKMSVILDFFHRTVCNTLYHRNHGPSTDGCKSVNRLQINPPSHFSPHPGLAGTRYWDRQRWEMAAQLFSVNTYTLHSHMQRSGGSFLTHCCRRGLADKPLGIKISNLRCSLLQTCLCLQKCHSVTIHQLKY